MFFNYEGGEAMNQNDQKKTSLGLDENLAGLLCYVLTWITGLIFLVVEKESRFVKFHALQSLITFLFLTIVSYIAGYVPFVGGLISLLIWPLEIVLWIVLMVNAYKNEMFKLPIIGDIAEQQVNRMMGV